MIPDSGTVGKMCGFDLNLGAFGRGRLGRVTIIHNITCVLSVKSVKTIIHDSYDAH
jgi:hypothetical protein